MNVVVPNIIFSNIFLPNHSNLVNAVASNIITPFYSFWLSILLPFQWSKCCDVVSNIIIVLMPNQKNIWPNPSESCECCGVEYYFVLGWNIIFVVLWNIFFAKPHFVSNIIPPFYSCFFFLILSILFVCFILSAKPLQWMLWCRIRFPLSGFDQVLCLYNCLGCSIIWICSICCGKYYFKWRQCNGGYDLSSNCF